MLHHCCTTLNKSVENLVFLFPAQVELVYTKFVSLISSDPIIQTLLPLTPAGEICDIDGNCVDPQEDELFKLTTKDGTLTLEREKVCPPIPCPVLNALIAVLNGAACTCCTTSSRPVAMQLGASRQVTAPFLQCSRLPAADLLYSVFDHVVTGAWSATDESAALGCRSRPTHRTSMRA